MPLSLVVDGTVYTQSGNKKAYESDIFSYDTNIPKAKAPTTTVSDDGTYMNYGLPIFFDFDKSDSSSSYYYTTYYGTGIRKATKTFYYNYKKDTPDPTPSEKYYLHISAKCVTVNSSEFTSSENTGIVVSLSLNNNESSSEGVSLSLFKLNSSLSLSCQASGCKTQYSVMQAVMHTTVSLPANKDFTDFDNTKYLYAIGIRPDDDYTYPNYTDFYSSTITWPSYNPTSIEVTLNDGTSVTATIIYH